MADDFQFIKETRKEKPINRKRLISHIVECVVLSILFGGLAALTFVLLEPRMEQYFTPEEKNKISFSESQDDEPISDSMTEGAASEKEESEEPETVIIEKPASMDLSEYQTLQNKLYAVGREADRFIVSVTNVKNNTDLFNTPYENEDIGSGAIIADTDEYLLILTEKKTIQGAASIRVTFVDDQTVTAKLQQYDGNTGLAVLRVEKENIQKDTLNQIAVAKLGTSVNTSQGQMVLAVGSPIGTIHSILTGNITSTHNSISTMDCNYTVFTTDMVGSANAGGALINTDGEIIGVILQDYNMQKEQTTIAAVSISELKGVIELLSNDEQVPYLGMRISTVTDEIAQAYEMPKGVYVREVALDSPAMEAGFQSGDVITRINGVTLTTDEGYEKLVQSFSQEEIIHISYKRQDAEDYVTLESDVRVGVLE